MSSDLSGVFNQKRLKLIIIIMIVIFSVFAIRLLSLGLSGDGKIKTNTLKDRALRGSIISSDGYTISRSIKTYSASFHTLYLDPNKKDFFLRLFSIYTNTPLEELKLRLIDKRGKLKKGWVTLSDNIDAKTAIYLKELKYKLNRFKVFTARGVNKNFYYGLTISQKGESREYPLKEALSPILGYTRSKDDNGYSYIVGFNGIEKFYDKYLNRKKDGLVSGKRDATGYIIHTDTTKYVPKENGYNLILNIDLGLQKNLDYILDIYKNKLAAKDIVVAVMKSSNSKLLAITSSNRYNPLNIKQDQIQNLQPKATTYSYEPGSVLKPITYALAINKGLITPDTEFDVNNGKMYIGRFKITDDEPALILDAKNIIIRSSNIGISKIAWKMKGQEFSNGLKKFGLGDQKSGIDIGREARGKMYSQQKLRSVVNKATTAYGYGIQATFAQLIKAYNVFNNDGVSYTPRAINYLQNDSGKKFQLTKDYTVLKPISKDSAAIVKRTLIDVVKKGTGRAAQIEGLEIGGKTGTAMIAGKGGYQKRYHCSFFGFANDQYGNKYTIGVLVVEPKYEAHFASQSAVPVFKRVVNALIERDMLKPNLSRQKQAEKEQKEKLKKSLIKQKQQQNVIDLKEKLRRQREQLIKRQKEMIKREKSKKRSNTTKNRTVKKEIKKSHNTNTKEKLVKPPSNQPDLF